MKITVNEAIALQNQLRGRLSNYYSLRNQISNRSTVKFSDGREERTDPQYDIKKVETRISSLETWLYRLDAKVKETNAKTELSLDVPVDELLSAVE